MLAQFITAQEAYQRAKTLNEQVDNSLLLKISSTIEAAYLKGKYAIDLYLDSKKDAENVRTHLNKLGYTVSVEEPYDQRDNTYSVRVSWADAQ